MGEITVKANFELHHVAGAENTYTVYSEGANVKGPDGKDKYFHTATDKIILAQGAKFEDDKINVQSVPAKGAKINTTIAVKIENQTGRPVIVEGKFEGLAGNFLRETTPLKTTNLLFNNTNITTTPYTIETLTKKGDDGKPQEDGVTIKSHGATLYAVRNGARVDEVLPGTKVDEIVDGKLGFLTVKGDEGKKKIEQRVGILVNITQEKAIKAVAPLPNQKPKTFVPAVLPNDREDQFKELGVEVLKDKKGKITSKFTFGEFTAKPNANANKEETPEPAIPYPKKTGSLEKGGVNIVKNVPEAELFSEAMTSSLSNLPKKPAGRESNWTLKV